MSVLDTSIIEAINTISQSNVKASNATLTIEGTIIEIIDAGLKQYRVEYMNNTFDAYANSGTFDVGDIVYIIVPEGDFSKKKIILSAVETSTSNVVDESSSEDYIEISNNLVDGNLSCSLYTWKSSEQELLPSDNNLLTTIKRYTDDGHNDFLLSARIKTNIELSQRVNGNYGLQLEIPVLVDPGTGKSVEEDLASWQTTQIVNLDIYTIQGNPYDLSQFSLQNTRQTLASGVEIDTSRTISLKGFVKGFQQLDSPDDDIYDIQIQDISFTAIQVLDEVQRTGYYLSLVSDTGNYFVENGSTTKTLSPIMKLNGKTTKIGEGYNCYQFVKDPSVNTTSQYYNILGGLGWKCLNSKTDMTTDEEGNQSFSWVTNVYKLGVHISDVSSVLTYKCVLVKDEKSFTATIDMVNTIGDIECSLISADGITTYGKDMGIVNLTGIMYYTGIDKNKPISVEWSRIGADGQVLNSDSFQLINEEYDVDNFYYRQNIKFNASIIDKVNIITCTFYQEEINEGILNKKILGEASLNIATTELTDSNLVVIQGADVLYKYDSDGNSPFVADYAYAAADVPVIQDITYKIFKPDGTEFTAAEYHYCKVTYEVPVDSLIKVTNSGVRTINKMQTVVLSELVDGTTALTYKIADVYNARKTDNYIKVTITYKDKILTATASPTFIKEGEAGTNGSKYTAVLTFNGKKYGEVITKQKIIKRDGSEETIDYTTAAKFQLAYIIPFGETEGEWYYSTYAGETLIKYEDDDFKNNFNVSVYCNGTLITDSSKYSVTWSIFDSFVTNPMLTSSNNKITIKDNATLSADSSTSTIVVADIKVGESSSVLGGAAQEVVRAYYPVEVCYINNVKLADELSSIALPHIAGGFDKVLYASDGTNPQYDNDNPFEFKDTLNLYLADGTYRNYQQQVPKQNNLTIISTKDTVCSVRPVTKFDNGISLNQIKGIMSVELTQDEYNEILDGITEANSIIEDGQNDLDNLDKLVGTDQGSLQSFVDNIKTMTTYASMLLKSRTEDGVTPYMNILKARGNMLVELQRLLSTASSIKEYIKSKELSQSEDQYSSFFETVIKKRKQLQKLAVDGVPSAVLIQDKTEPISKFGMTDKTINGVAKYFNLTGTIDRPILSTLLSSYNELKRSARVFDNKLAILLGYENNENYFEVLQQSLFAYIQDPFDDYELFNYFSSFEKFNSLVKISDLMTLYNSEVMRLTIPQSEYDYSMDAQEEEEKIANLYDESIYPIYFQYSDIENLLETLENVYNDVFVDTIVNYVNNILKAEIKSGIEKANKALIEYNSLLEYYNNQKNIVITKPIIMLYNAYEMSNLSSQDGNKLYIDDNHGEDAQYLLAPQIGAGKKTEDEKFTGMIMGIRSFAKDNSTRANQIGMFAYNEGQQTYFLNAEDGSAIMGEAGGGQIIIDPKTNKGLIYSSTFYKAFDTDGKPSNYSKTNESGEGMIIDLTTPEIRFGNGNFKVTSEGNLTAVGGGLIGGWVIGDTELYSNESESDGRITLKAGNKMLKGYPCELADSKNTVVTIYQEEEVTENEDAFTYIKFDNDKNFYKITSIENKKVINIENHDSVTTKEEIDDNYITTHSVVDKYYISSGNGGSIYSHTHNALGNTDPGFYLSDNGLSIGSKVKITNEGVAYFGDGAVGKTDSGKYQTINGEKGESYISYNTAAIDTVANSVYIGTNGISLGTGKFKVDNSGSLFSASGKIGGQTIGESTLTGESSGGKIVLNAKGAIEARKGDSELDLLWSINRNGDAKFNNITCTNIFSFGSGNNTQSSQDGFNFKNGFLGSNSVTTDGFAFAAGTIGLGDTSTVSGGITYNSDGVTISGTIYARAGEIGGCSISGGKLTVPSANITGELKAEQIDVEGLVSSQTFQGSYLEVSGINCKTGFKYQGTAYAPSSITYLSKDGQEHTVKILIANEQ